MKPKKNREKIKMIVFRNHKGEPVFAVPGSMTLKEWFQLGFPKPELVPKNVPQKENELRA